ncbi:MAG: transposase [Chloroflexota bacterium]
MTHSREAVLAIDFSLDRLDVSLRSDQPGWGWAHRAYVNNEPGYQQLKTDLLAALHQQTSIHLTGVGESTGLYWWHAFYHLSHDAELAAYEPELALLNPLYVKRFRQALSQQDKSDQLDPCLIDRYYRAVGVKDYYQFNDRYLPLRFLSRAYYRVTHILAAQKAYLLAIVFLTASDYQRLKPFSDLLGVTSGQVLEEWAEVQALADLPLETLTAQLQTLAGHTLPDPAHNAHLLRQVAQDSYPLPPALAETLHLIVQQTLSQIRFLSDNQKAYRQQISQALTDFPEADLALAEPGLGPILVAGCLSEIQDTQRFMTGSKFDRQRQCQRPKTYRDGQAAVANLAGLWWPAHDSGRFLSQDRHLSRERNPYLRYWLVQAANSLRQYQPDYSRYYWRKYHETQKHQHKRALILTARKAVRLIFALLHKGQLHCREEGRLI